MTAFRLSRAAASDLAEIINYIERHSGPRQALDVLDRFHQAFEMLAAHPAQGHRHAFISDPEVRVWGVHSFLIVYWPVGTPLGIARIIHGHRDLPTVDIPTSE